MNIIIDGRCCEAAEGEFILNIARRNGIHIPTLCHSDALPGQASCRLCMVEVVENKRHRVVASCVYPVTREIEVVTNSQRILNMRCTIISLISAMAPGNEQVKALRDEYHVDMPQRFSVDKAEKCILCGLCVRACDEMGKSAISAINRGITKKIATPYDEPSAECMGCGACASVCPADAIEVREYDGKRTIWNKTFELLKCSRCGRHFATREMMEYVNKKLGTDNTGEVLCEKCRQELLSRKLRDIFL